MTEVAVHHADPDGWSAHLLERAQAAFSAAERERAAAFRFERDRRLYVVAHCMLRAALAARVGVSPHELVFVHNAHGRPELAGDTGIRFSLAHAHGMAVCAITADHDVGVDVEPVDRAVNLSIAERWFDPSELADVRGCPEPERGPRFFRYWTLKEAYVKARGIGLSLGIQNVAFDLLGDSVRFRPSAAIEPARELWHFRSFRLGARHQAALALRAPSPPALNLVAFNPPAP